MPPIITLLTIGPVHTLVDDQTYAMPVARCQIAVDPPAAIIEGSVDQSTWTVIEDDPAGKGIIPVFPFPFIRCTDVAGCLIRLNRA